MLRNKGTDIDGKGGPVSYPVKHFTQMLTPDFSTDARDLISCFASLLSSPQGFRTYLFPGY